MATVLLSDRLVNSIVWNIEKPMRAKVAELESRAAKLMASQAKEVWDHYYSKYVPALNAVPLEFLRTSTAILINIKDTEFGTKLVRATLNETRAIPINAEAAEGVELPTTNPVYNEVRELMLEAKRLGNEIGAVGPKFKELCSQCGSLADLIKIFPSVTNYLDEEIKARLNRKVTPKKNKPKELPEDLAVSLIKSRIFQSTQS